MDRRASRAAHASHDPRRKGSGTAAALAIGRADRPQRSAGVLASTAAAIAAIPATRWPRRCSRTACIWSARSFKYHRPRGILTAGPEEPNALVELRAGARREPNTRATTAELYDGLEAASQNRWPSLRFDLLAVNSLLAPVLSAGFYYKTFMWPASFWEKVYEPLIRRAAGLGRAAGAGRPRHLREGLPALRRAGGRRRRRPG